MEQPSPIPTPEPTGQENLGLAAPTPSPLPDPESYYRQQELGRIFEDPETVGLIEDVEKDIYKTDNPVYISAFVNMLEKHQVPTRGFFDRFMYGHGPQVENARIASVLEDRQVTIGDAAQSMGMAVSEGWGRSGDFLTHALKPLAALGYPEQMVARTLVPLLQNSGKLNYDQAAKLLAQEDLMYTDIINSVWHPTTNAGVWARMGVNLAAEVFADPLNYVTLGASGAGKVGRVGLKEVKDLHKLDSGLRQLIYKSEEMTNVLKATGSDKSLETAQEALDLFAANKIPADRFIGMIEADDATKAALKKIIESPYNEMEKGKRAIGLSAPFSGDPAIEFTKASEFLAKAGNKVSENKILQAASGAWHWMASDFKDRLANISARGWLGESARSEVELMFLQKSLRREFDDLMKDVPAHLAERKINDVWDELERGFSQEDLINKSMARDLKGKGLDEKQLDVLFEETTKDAERSQRLTEADRNFISKLRKGYDQVASEKRLMKESGFTPFDPTKEIFENSPRNYAAHVMSKEFKALFDDTEQAIKAADQFMEEVGGVSQNQSNKMRQDRRLLSEINAQAKAVYGKEMFVANPVEAFVKHIEEHRRTQNFYELMKKLRTSGIVRMEGDKVPVPPDYIKFNPADFHPYVRRAMLTGEIKPEDAQKILNRMLPSFWHVNSKRAVYLPPDVYNWLHMHFGTEVIKNPMAEALYKSLQTFNYVWRNSALFGAAYLAKNLTSNLMTYYVTNKWIGGTKNMALAVPMMARDFKFKLGMLSDNNYKLTFRSPDGKPFQMTERQFMNLAYEKNVIDSGTGLELNYRDWRDGYQSMFDAKNKTKTILETAMAWNLNRYMAQMGDNVPKLAMFKTLMERGFTADAASELVEKNLFSFNRYSPGQRMLRAALPFQSFMMKTSELAIDRLKNLDFARLTFPGKVADVFQGTYMEDENLDREIRNALPVYAKGVLENPIIDLVPGGKALILNIPSAQSALSFWAEVGGGNLAGSLHPAVGFGLALAGFNSDAQYNQRTNWENASDKLFQSTMSLGTGLLAVPRFMIESRAGREGAPGSLSAKQFAPQWSRSEADKNNVALQKQRQNAIDFGLWVEKSFGSGWLYSLLFPKRITADNAQAIMPEDQLKAIARGNFVKKYFTQLTLGAVIMTDFDKAVWLKSFALSKEKTRLYKQLNEELADQGVTIDPSVTKEQISKLAAKSSYGIQYLKVSDELDSAISFWSFARELEDKEPGLLKKLYWPQSVYTEEQLRSQYDKYQDLQKRSFKDVQDRWMEMNLQNQDTGPGWVEGGFLPGGQ